MKQQVKSTLALGSAVVAVVGLVVTPSAYAVNQSSSTTVRATVGSTISVSSTPTVTMNITPTGGGAQASATDTVTVSTNNASGYTLSLKDSDATLTLVNGANTIAAHAGTWAAPTVLANNAWGYAIGSGTGGGVTTTQFDTTATYGSTPNTAKWAGITASDQNIKSTSVTAANDTLTVYYSAKIDTTKPNGNYDDAVTYTATTNP